MANFNLICISSSIFPVRKDDIGGLGSPSSFGRISALPNLHVRRTWRNINVLGSNLIHIVLCRKIYSLSWVYEAMMLSFWIFVVSRTTFISVFGVADFVR
jgi:hypothetical protein